MLQLHLEPVLTLHAPSCIIAAAASAQMMMLMQASHHPDIICCMPHTGQQCKATQPCVSSLSCRLGGCSGAQRRPKLSREMVRSISSKSGFGASELFASHGLHLSMACSQHKAGTRQPLARAPYSGQPAGVRDAHGAAGISSTQGYVERKLKHLHTREGTPLDQVLLSAYPIGLPWAARLHATLCTRGVVCSQQVACSMLLVPSRLPPHAGSA